jgi:putative transposase
MNMGKSEKEYSGVDKLKIINYCDKYGFEATAESVLAIRGRTIGLSTIKLWKSKRNKSIERNYGSDCCVIYDLTDKSRKPKTYRQTKIHGSVADFVMTIRKKYGRIGKDKIKILYDQYREDKNTDSNKSRGGVPLPPVSASSFGRLINSLSCGGRLLNLSWKQSIKVGLHGGTGKLQIKVLKPKKQDKFRRKDYNPKEAGDLLQVDCITLIKGRVRRYLVCAIDTVTKFSFVYAYKNLNSSTTTDFTSKLQHIFPIKIKHIQTDNGQEFHKHFQENLKQEGITQFWNYPRSPKMNAFIERFNRTIQEEWVNTRLWQIFDTTNDPDLRTFNKDLVTDYLTWYNFQRPHQSLQYMSPMQVLRDNFEKGQKSNMLWTRTASCQNKKNVLHSLYD